MMQLKRRNFFLKAWVLLLSFFVLNSCVTKAILQEQPYSVSEIRKAVTMISGEPRSISQNGRELLSHFHDRKKIPLTADEMTLERLYTKVIVLGDRRPYDIAVEVHVETKDEAGNFEDSGERDEGLEEKFAKEIQAQLYQSRSNDPNVVDDFRAF